MNSMMMPAYNTMGEIQKQMDGITNNLSNSNQIGYKRRESTFSDLLFQQINNQPNANQLGRRTPEGIRQGNGAGIAQTALRLEQGALKQTDRELDFAITDEDSFFQVENTAGGAAERRYSKDGNFKMSENPESPGSWTLVNSSGEYVLGENGERINMPAGARDITLLNNGQLTAVLENGETAEIGSIELAKILKPQLLENQGGNSYTLPDPALLDVAEEDMIELQPGTSGLLQQNTLEQSNVDMGQEMTNLIQAQRNYSFNARAITQGDQMMGLINSVRG